VSTRHTPGWQCSYSKAPPHGSRPNQPFAETPVLACVHQGVDQILCNALTLPLTPLAAVHLEQAVAEEGNETHQAEEQYNNSSWVQRVTIASRAMLSGVGMCTEHCVNIIL
jgi:hypothetical protein